MTEGLLPCPKCGNQNAQMFDDGRHYYITCNSCHSTIYGGTASADTANFWNYLSLKSKKEAIHV